MDVTLDMSATRKELVQLILNQWEDDLFRVDFALRFERNKGNFVDIATDESLTSFLKSNILVIKVETLTTGFSKMKEADVKD